MHRSSTYLQSCVFIAALFPLLSLSAACSSTGDDSAAAGGTQAAGGSNGEGGSDAGASNATGGNGATAGANAAGGSDASAGNAGELGANGAAGQTNAAGPAPVVLGSAGKYVIIAQSKAANVPTSVVTGDIALSPAAASYITGFSLTKAGVNWTSAQVIGSVFAADNDPPTPRNLTTAVASMHTAYTDAAGRATPDFLNLGSGAIGGLTLSPGLYKWTSAVTVPLNVTIAGEENDTWIFQITGDLTMSANKAAILSGGAQAKNIVWQVAGAVQLGAGAHLEGVVLSKTAITLGAGASINGRLFAQTAVNIASSTVTSP
jgi:hypothetical protein